MLIHMADELEKTETPEEMFRFVKKHIDFFHKANRKVRNGLFFKNRTKEFVDRFSRLIFNWQLMVPENLRSEEKVLSKKKRYVARAANYRDITGGTGVSITVTYANTREGNLARRQPYNLVKKGLIGTIWEHYPKQLIYILAQYLVNMPEGEEPLIRYDLSGFTNGDKACVSFLECKESDHQDWMYIVANTNDITVVNLSTGKTKDTSTWFGHTFPVCPTSSVSPCGHFLVVGWPSPNSNESGGFYVSDITDPWNPKHVDVRMAVSDTTVEFKKGIEGWDVVDGERVLITNRGMFRYVSRMNMFKNFEG